MGEAGPADEGPHPHRLTDEEMEWCLGLKERLENDGIPLPATDYELAQFAIVSKADTSKGARRVAAYTEHIVEPHGYSLDKALRGDIPGLGFYNSKWPRVIEPCAPSGDRQHPTIVFNCAAYRPSEVDADSELGQMIVDKLLLYDALSADLNDVRVGCHVINQAAGAGFHNFCHSLEKKLSVVSQDAYPLKYTKMPVVDAGWMMGAIFKIVRPLLRPKLRERIVVCKSAELQDRLGYSLEGLPDIVGGTRGADPDAYETWLRAQLARRAESIAAVRIE